MYNFLTFLVVLSMSSLSLSEETWTLGSVEIQGKPVVYKFMTELPAESIRKFMPWLTVVSWKYDGTNNNGMPEKSVNTSMIKLEDGLETIVGREKIYFDVYSATGNNLKEFVFYISSRDEFMVGFNKALKGHEAYPIEINFYQDAEWSDIVKLQGDFSAAANRVAGGI